MEATSPATVARKPGHRGEHDISVKTIARGMPGVFRCDRGDYTRMLTFILHARLRALSERPAFPAPSVSESGSFWQNSRGSRGEIAKLTLLFEN